jgi:GT2 family glycosyltransferase
MKIEIKQMKLSIVIVNYNVEHFLEQCLYAVKKAIDTETTEVWVVDNSSVDGSVAMVKEKFPWVKLIESKKNLGFSSGNNLAIRQSTGEYILLLNPDTVVEEDTFEKCIEFMDQHPEAGGLGVKMLDGNGHYLPESKRGLPTPWVAFYKIFGLTSLFPRSARFARYYLGHLPNNETNEIEILSGAFMFMRKSVLDEIGLLDEAFFMYGEDIDLSYRILKSGSKNYYYPETRIIHYKGESTKKGSINYVMVFYQAMIIFAKKHYTVRHARMYQFVINMAIYMRAGLALINRFLKKAFLPALDFIAILLLLFTIKNLYESYSGISYSADLITRGFILYAIVWMVSVLYSGGYDKPVKLWRIVKGLFFGTLIILAGYSLLPEELRFSRAIILLGFGSVLTFYLASRYIFSLIGIKGYSYSGSKTRNFAIAGDTSETERVELIIQQSNRGVFNFIKVSPKLDFNKTKFVGSIEQLLDITKVYNINEVVFCAKNISSQKIISAMSELDTRIDCKIAPPESLYIIGSNSINTSGDLYMLDVNAINRPANKRNKRTLDIFLSLVMLVLSPVLIFFVKNPLSFIRNIFQVIIGKKTWVGYASYPSGVKQSYLPAIRKGIISPAINAQNADDENYIRKMNVIYAKDYRIFTDVGLVVKGLPFLGNRSV